MADAFVERFVVEPVRDGPLRGTSFAVKDLFDVAGRPTSCGNPTWRATHSPPTTSAAVVGLLLGAGARLVGKTRTDEMAYSLDGRNFHEGAPINPAAPERLTGGSSSGSASAAAAGSVDFAIGTDTAGSVRVPAAWCGLVGIRPTHARVPVGGLTPLAPSFDTVGWFAQSTSLMRTIGTVLLGDGAVPAPQPSLLHDVGVDRHAFEVPADALRPAFDRCASLGLAVSEGSLNVDVGRVAECLRVLQAKEAWSTHGLWIETVHPSFGPGIAERFEVARRVAAGTAQILEAERERDAIIARVDAALPPGRILCLPTVPGPALRRDASAEQLQLRRAQLLPLTALASLTGRPQISLPLLHVEQAPVGFSLLGWRGGDEALLAIATRILP
jgi:amidase